MQCNSEHGCPGSSLRTKFSLKFLLSTDIDTRNAFGNEVAVMFWYMYTFCNVSIKLTYLSQVFIISLWWRYSKQFYDLLRQAVHYSLYPFSCTDSRELYVAWYKLVKFSSSPLPTTYFILPSLWWRLFYSQSLRTFGGVGGAWGIELVFLSSHSICFTSLS